MRWWWLFAWLWVAAPAQARWLEAETPNFIIYGDSGEAKLREFALLLEDYDALLRMLTQAAAKPLGNKLQVYLVRGNAALREIRNVPRSAAGLYSASATGSAAFVIPRDAGGEYGVRGEEVLLHEYAHHFMLQHFPFAYPAWYIEGFAEYLMTAQFEPARIEVGRFSMNRAAWLARGNWLPAEKLFTVRPSELRGEDGAMFYAQAWLAAHYINRTPGKAAALRRYLLATAEGTPPAVAFQAAFGTDFDGFQRELRRYVRGKMTYTSFNRTAAKSPPVTVRVLPASADDLLLPLAHLRVGVGPQWRAERLATIRRAAARYPDDAFAETVLALAEARLGDANAAVTLASRVLTRDANDVDALLARATALLALARQSPDRPQFLSQARQSLVRANKLAPNQAPILYAYALTQMAGGPPTRQVLDLLIVTRALAPQSPDIGMLTAFAAMHHGDFTGAENILKPIAFDPHGGPAAAAAARMLEAARARRVETLPTDQPGR